MSDTPLPLCVYVVRNHLGQFCTGGPELWPNSPKGCWSNHAAWARLYHVVGPARALVTKYVKAFPNDPAPVILSWELDPAKAVVLDDAKRAKRAVANIGRAKVVREAQLNRQEMEHLQAEQARIAVRLAQLPHV